MQGTWQLDSKSFHKASPFYLIHRREEPFKDGSRFQWPSFLDGEAQLRGSYLVRIELDGAECCAGIV